MSYPISSQPRNRRMHSHVASLSQKKTSKLRVTASLSRGSLILTQIPKFGLVLVLVVVLRPRCTGVSCSEKNFLVVDLAKADRWNGALPLTLLEGTGSVPLLSLQPGEPSEKK